MQAGLPVRFHLSEPLFAKPLTTEQTQRDLMRFESAIPLLQFYANRLMAADLPAGYAIIPIIESNNTPKAISRAGAAGVWQLMPDTALKYGLRVDFHEDERYLVSQATSAAIKHLRYLSGLFSHPVHVLAAYNWGEQNVLRLLKTKPTLYDFMQAPQLPTETRDYVLRILGYWRALSVLDGQHALHFYPNVNYFVVDVSSAPDYSSDPRIQRFLNPLQSLSRERLVPTSYFYTFFQSKVGEGQKRNEPKPPCASEQTIVNLKLHVVQEGDSYERIIKKYNITQAAHRNAIRAIALQPGMVLKIPVVDTSQNYVRDVCQ